MAVGDTISCSNCGNKTVQKVWNQTTCGRKCSQELYGNKNRKKINAYGKTWREANPTYYKERYHKKNKSEYRARSKVSNEIIAGRLPPAKTLICSWRTSRRIPSS